MRFLRTFLFVLVAALAVLLAYANRDPATLKLDPFPYAIETSLFGLLLAAFFFGVALGAFASWWAGRERRREARLWRQSRREKDTAEKASAPADPT